MKIFWDQRGTIFFVLKFINGKDHNKTTKIVLTELKMKFLYTDYVKG